MKDSEERQTFFRQVRRELQNDVKNARLAPQKQLALFDMLKHNSDDKESHLSETKIDQSEIPPK